MESRKILPFPLLNNQVKKESPNVDDLKYQYTEFTGKIQIEIAQLYDADRSDPEQNQYHYLYQIRITNHGALNVELRDRRWQIREGSGERYVVHNKWPMGSITLGPGEFFDYSGFLPLHSSTGNMRGRILSIDESREEVWVNVPVFFFRRN